MCSRLGPARRGGLRRLVVWLVLEIAERVGGVGLGVVWHGWFYFFNDRSSSMATTATRKPKRKRTANPNYTVRQGAQFDEETADEFIKLLSEHDGPIKKDQLLALASKQPKSSLAYKYFDWDNKSAANKHRLSQAQHVLTHIMIIPGHDEKPVRAYYNVQVITAPDRKERAYVPLEIVQNTDYLREQVIEQAISEINAWKERYETYKRIFGPVFQAINKVSARNKKKTRAA